MPNLYAGLRDAPLFDRGVFFDIGSFDLEVVRSLAKQSQRSGLVHIVEFKILDSNQPKNPAGSNASWVQSFKTQSIAFSAIKEFIAATYGFHPKNEKERIQRELNPYIDDLAERADSAENILAGRRVHLETHMTKTRERGTDFTIHTWSPYGSEPVKPPAPIEQYAPPPMSPRPAQFGPPPQQFATPQAQQYGQGYGAPSQAPQAPQYAPQAQYGAPQGPQYPPQAPQYGAPQAPQYAPQTPQYGAPQAPAYGAPQNPPAYGAPQQWPPQPQGQGWPPRQ